MLKVVHEDSQSRSAAKSAHHIPAVCIRSTAIELPGSPVSTEELLTKLNDRLSDDFREMLKNLGVTSRYSVIENYPDYLAGRCERKLSTSTTQMATMSARECLSRAEAKRERIRLLIAVTNTADRPMPCMAYEVLSNLRDMISLDINVLNLQGQGCSALLKAFAIAQDFLASHPDAQVLVCVAESHSAYSPPFNAPRYETFKEIEGHASAGNYEAAYLDTQRALGTFLFGDAAVAFLLEDEGMEGFHIGPIVHITNLDARDTELLTMNQGGAIKPAYEGFPAYIMGERVPNRGAAYVESLLQNLKANPDSIGHELDPTKLDFCLIHTGSRKILQHLCDQLSLSTDAPSVRIGFHVLERYANTSSCSLGLMIERLLQDGVHGSGIMLGFGVGFSASAGLCDAH